MTYIESNVKEFPQKGAEIVCIIKENVEAIILEDTNYYYKVSFTDENGETKEGYVAKAFRYMTKPFDYEELHKNMDACLDELKLYKIILVSSRGNTQKIRINEILYFIAQPGGSEIKTIQTTHYCDESLKQWELKTSSSLFFRCHKKYLVNLNAITKIKNHSILLSNGEELPVSRRKWTLLKTAYVRFDIAIKGKE